MWGFLWLLEPLFAGPASDTCADDSKKRITHTPPSPAAKRGGANFDYWQQVSTVTPNRIVFSRAPLTLLKKSFPLFFYSKSSKHDRNRRSRRRFSAFRWRSVEICALPRADVFSGENRELKSDWRYYLKCLIPKKDIRKVNQFSFEFCFSNAETQRENGSASGQLVQPDIKTSK